MQHLYGEDLKIVAWNTVEIIERTLEIINFKDINLKYVGRKASSSTATEMQTNILRNKRNIRKDTKEINV